MCIPKLALEILVADLPQKRGEFLGPFDFDPRDLRHESPKVDKTAGVAVLVLVLIAIGVWFFFFIGCGAWSASLAEKRGRNMWAFGALGFFFGPIGVLISALMSPDHAALSQTSTKACPHCAERIQPEARVCRYCQRDLVPS